ncbi:MAG: carboxypeptidase-like regulatory domain-containing protein, partial [Chitinophagaceae bacterium]|nr:carboxypeptidase-like regulatory domain-containing protein [Chitinophagaceae bacterium]
ISLGSDYPIVEAKYTRGISGILRSSFNYSRISAGISQYKTIPPFGSLYYNVFAGKTYGTLPYMLLDIAPGNELYYYDKYSFNLMNRYEFLHDQYAGVNFEHNIGNGLFRFIPLLKKLKFRQFYSARALWGSLSDANKSYNTIPGSNFAFQSLNGKTYLEEGTGVDNIFKLFRIDFVWRLLPSPLPVEHQKKFGIFGSFRLAF